jgi:hypothetical protein
MLLLFYRGNIIWVRHIKLNAMDRSHNKIKFQLVVKQ